VTPNYSFVRTLANRSRRTTQLLERMHFLMLLGRNALLTINSTTNALRVIDTGITNRSTAAIKTAAAFTVATRYGFSFI